MSSNKQGTKMIRQKRKSRRLSYENLESRKMLAGDVTVVEDGQLYIRGDELSNQIRIAADESGQVLVTGLNSTTINGSSNPFVVTGTVNLNGARGRNASFDGGLRILTYGGDDRIDIRNIELNDSSVIMTGEGDDFVRFIRSSSNEDLFTNTDAGDDTLVFFQARVFENFDVFSGIGDDSIRLHNSRTAGDTSFYSEVGDDHVILNRVRFTGESQQVMTHDGHDKIELRNNDLNENGLAVYAGNGRDEVIFEMNSFNDVESEIVVAGQGGFDVIETYGDGEKLELLKPNGFENIDSEVVYRGGEDFDNSIGSGFFGPHVTPYRVAGSFGFNEDTSVGSIEWQGFYGRNSEAGPIPETDHFIVEIFANGEDFGGDEGAVRFEAPAESLATFELTNEVNRTDSGSVWHNRNGGTDTIFDFSAEIDFDFEAGEIYWVSIGGISPFDATDNAGVGFVWGYEDFVAREGVFKSAIQYPGLDYFISDENNRADFIFSLNS